MNTTLILVGVVCIIAAVVGGGLKALGIELPAIESVRRQIMLAIIGLILVVVGAMPPNEIQPFNEVEPATIADNTATSQAENGSATTDRANSELGNTAESSNGNESVPHAPPLQRDPADRKRATVQSVIDELNEATPFHASAQNQFANGILDYNHFILIGGDVQVSTTFTYQLGDGTGWPPKSPPTQAVNTFFCKTNASTAKLLKEGVHFIVTTKIVRGPNTSNSTYQVDCGAVDP